MISKKVFEGDGSNNRFLSDFIIRSEQYTRVYNYMYDINGVEGDVDPSSGLYIRVVDIPNSADLVTIDKWDLVDNSISFYTPPYTGSRIYIEVATTPEEFGDTLVQPSVERAEEAAVAAANSATAALASENAAAASEAAASASATASAASADASQTSNLASEAARAASYSAQLASEAARDGSVAAKDAAVVAQSAAEVAQAAAEAAETAAQAAQTAAETAETNAQLRAWEAEAEQMTANAYAIQAEDVFVSIWTSDGDGTFTSTPSTDYSSLHWAAKSAESAAEIPLASFPTDESKALIARATGNDWEQIDGADVAYDNTISGLAATDVKVAIDELEAEKATLAEANTFSGNNTFEGTVQTDTISTENGATTHNIDSMGIVHGNNGGFIYYSKFPDGTLIIHGRVNIAAGWVSGATNSKTLITSITAGGIPPFINLNYSHTTQWALAAGLAGEYIATPQRSSSRVAGQITCFFTSASAYSSDSDLQFQLIGRWK